MFRSSIALIALTCGAVFLESAAPADEAAKAPEESALAMRTMRIVVKNEKGEPLPGAKIHVAIWAKAPASYFKNNRDYVCDDKGAALIETPVELDILRIWSRHIGYAPLFAQWWPEHDPTALPIPDEFPFTMTKGVEIGGVILDEAGAPIRDARVEVRRVNQGENEMTARPMYCVWLAIGEESPHAAQRTDAQGFWSINNAPPGDDIKLSLLVSHPDYISDSNWGGLQAEQEIELKSLRANDARIVLKKGVRLAGKVTGPDGAPISGAVVIWGDNPYFQWGSQEILTGEDGEYRLPALPEGETTITVVAKGFAPALASVELSKDADRHDVALAPGRSLKIKFVDGEGAPLEGVRVSIESWLGASSLYNHRHPEVADTQIPIESATDGVFTWDWAPAEKVTYTFWKDGYQPKEGVPLAAGAKTHEISLSKAK